MKPEQFISDFGEKKAREIVEGTPDKTATHYVADTDTYYSEDFLTYFDHSLEDWETADLNNISELETIYEHVVNLSDLKRLVESLDIINDLGGIDAAKGTLAELIKLDWDEFEHRWIDNWMCTRPRLESAIKDHESIYGGGQ